MRKAITFLVLFCCSFSHSFAQTMISGVVRDSIQHESMTDIAIVLMTKKDSMLVKSVRTDSTGYFRISGVDAGAYIILVSSATYVDYTDFVNASGRQHIDLGKINMITRSKLLQEVVVKGALASITIKGDTTEFVADSFHLQSGASVEDLLKRLPGIRIDKDGKITAQGETVKKVLVDGEEFFGDDPTLVTKNLRADIIDKVQLYDKKSDLAIATGINDGVKDKTINLKLKEDSRKGDFGKIVAGAGLNGYYENQAMINLFKNKQKISFYGTWANTGRIGLGTQDNEKYNVGKNESVTRDSELDTWNGNYEGQGIPVARTGGIHFSDKWNEDRQAVSLNYRIAGLTVEGSNNTITQNNLPGEIIYSRTNHTFRNNSIKNKLTGDSEIKPDSATSVKLSMTGSLNHKTTDNYYLTSTSRGDSTLLNSGTRQLNNSGNLGNLNTNILITKKLQKKGRSISLNLHENYIDDNTEGFINTMNTFHKGWGDSVVSIIQRKTDVSRSLYLDGKAVFTEPLSRSLVMSVSYGLFVNTSKSEVATYNKSTEGKYDKKDSTLSNNYQFDQRIHQGGIVFNYNTNKVHLNYGVDVGLANLVQANENNSTRLNRNFVNWYPSAEIAYVIKMQKSISAYYKGNNQMPAINQLQPVPNINDPLNIYIGNPELNPSYTNVLGLRYNSYQTAGEKYLFSNFNYAFSGNQITTNTFTDSSGRNIYRYLNVAGNSNYWGYLGLGKKLLKLDINAGLNVNVSGGRGVNFSNSIKNVLSNHSYGLELYANKYKADLFDLSMKLVASYNSYKSSLQESAPVNYWSYNISPDITFFIPGGFQLHTDFNYQIRQKTTVFRDNLNVFLWNAWLNKNLIKDGSLSARFSANDLLNQNKGFSRSVSGNFIMQNNYTTIQQFFLLSVNWNFTHNSASNNNR